MFSIHVMCLKFEMLCHQCVENSTISVILCGYCLRLAVVCIFFTVFILFLFVKLLVENLILHVGQRSLYLRIMQ